MQINSLARRLHLGLALSLAALLLVLGWLLDLSLRHLSEDWVASRLQHDAENLLAATRFDAAGRPLLEPPGAMYQQPLSGHYYSVLWNGSPPLRSRSLWDTELAGQMLPPGASRRYLSAGPQQQILLAWAAGFRKSGHAITVLVAEDLTPLHGALAQLRGYYLGFGLLALLLLIAAQHWVIQRSLRGLRQAREDLRRLEHGEVPRLTEAVPSEILPLVQEVNRLLGSLQQRIERSRNALGNLAHALKTPLTVIDQISRQPALPPGVALELQTHVQALSQRIEHELKRARLAGKAAPGKRFLPAEELPLLLDILRRIYPDKTLRLECPPEIEFAGDREDLLELFGNLLDNACKWAHSTVLCEITAGPGLIARISDDGPGIPPAEWENLLRRGQRLDESTPGYGLGLAIAADIVQLYRGKIEFSQAGIGGLQVRLKLPE